MAWPTPQEYNEAIQTPSFSFADPELQGGTPEVTSLGLPRPITGNFASVYRVHCSGRDWAVRCLWREYADMQRRYSEISRHLKAAQLPYTVGFEYLPQGIRVGGSWYPLLKMEWVQGELLNEYVGRIRHDPVAMGKLIERWRVMVQAMEQAGIAHGDLQHGNVLVVSGEFKLVDYDAMFVPGLAGSGSHEIGHQNYQHPRRAASHFGPGLDRFSAWVIYLSLLALRADPTLWPISGWEERLLVDRDDLAKGRASPLLAALAVSPDAQVSAGAQQLFAALGRGPLDAPPLEAWARSRPKVRRAREIESIAPARPAPSWLILPAEEPPFRLSPAAGRVALVILPLSIGVGILALLSGLVFLLPVSAVVGLLFSSTALELAYRREPATAAWRDSVAARRRERRALRSLNRAAGKSDRREEKASLAVETAIRRLEERRNRMAGTVSDRKSRISATGHEALALLEEDRADLDRAEREALLMTLDAYYSSLVSAHLRRMRILSRHGPPIGWIVRLRLWIRGVRTAEDVVRHATKLSHVGSAAAAAVLGWRAACDLSVRHALPPDLKARDRAAIIARYTRFRRAIDRAERIARERVDRMERLVDDSFQASSRRHQEMLDAAFSRRTALQTSLNLEREELAHREALVRWKLSRALGDGERLSIRSRTSYWSYLLHRQQHDSSGPADVMGDRSETIPTTHSDRATP